MHSVTQFGARLLSLLGAMVRAVRSLSLLTLGRSRGLPREMQSRDLTTSRDHGRSCLPCLPSLERCNLVRIRLLIVKVGCPRPLVAVFDRHCWAADLLSAASA